MVYYKSLALVISLQSRIYKTVPFMKIKKNKNERFPY